MRVRSPKGSRSHRQRCPDARARPPASVTARWPVRIRLGGRLVAQLVTPRAREPNELTGHPDELNAKRFEMICVGRVEWRLARYRWPGAANRLGAADSSSIASSATRQSRPTGEADHGTGTALGWAWLSSGLTCGRTSEAADGVGKLERDVVVVHVPRCAIPEHGACSSVAFVQIGVGGEAALAVVFDEDAVTVEGVADERGPCRRGCHEEA